MIQPEKEKELDPRTKYLLKTGLFFIGIGFFVWGVFGVKSRFPSRSLSSTPLAESAPKARAGISGEETKEKSDSDQVDGESGGDQDKEILLNGHSDPKKIANAIRRLSFFEKELVLSKIKEFVNHNSEDVRRSVMYALSLDYDSNSFNLLVEGLKDKSQAVRLEALGALSRRSEERVGGLADIYLRKKNLPVVEKIAAHKLKYLSLKFPQDKKKYFQNFIDLADQASVQDLHRIISTAASLAPNDKRLISFMRNRVQGEKNHSLVNTCIVNLAKVKDPWIIANIDSFLKDKNRNIRVSALNALAYSCAPNQWSKLRDAIVAEKDQHVLRSALRVPRVIGGVGAIHFLESLVEPKNSILSANLKNEAKKELSLVKQSPKAICH